MKSAGIAILAATLVLGCGSNDSSEQPAKAADTAATPAAKKPRKKITAEDVTKATHYLARKEHGDGIVEEGYVPAEFKSGKKRWRDAAAYVDGVPIAMFWHGEMPRGLKPVWVEDEVDIDYNKKEGGPTHEIIKSRRYRIDQFLEAAGVDLTKFKEIHIYGPNSQILVIDQAAFKKFRHLLRFRFGGGTEGKAIADIPRKLAKNFDRLMGVSVYVKKRPPKIREEGAFLKGKLVEGVPYYGEPLRGGIRVYLDDRMITRFKRNTMNEALGTKLPDDTISYKLFEVLEYRGVNTDKIAQLEIIHDEARTVRFDRDELKTMTFRSVPQAKGQIQLNGKVFAHALAFYSEKLPDKTAANAAAPATTE